MSARRIDGKAAAAALRARVAEARRRFLPASTGRAPGLATVLVGEDPASEVYVRTKGKAPPKRAWRASTTACRRHDARPTARPGRRGSTPIRRSTASSSSCRCRPHIDAARVIDAIDPGQGRRRLPPVNAGRLAIGDPTALVPCTPLGCMILLKARARRPRRARRRGDRPLEHRRQADGAAAAGRKLHGHHRAQPHPRPARRSCARADILVAAVGRPEMVRGDWIKPGATVIDVGINRMPAPKPGKTRLVGDVAFDEAARGRGRDHAGARRGRADDHRHAAAQHARRGAPPRRPRRHRRDYDPASLLLAAAASHDRGRGRARLCRRRAAHRGNGPPFANGPTRPR